MHALDLVVAVIQRFSVDIVQIMRMIENKKFFGSNGMINA